MPGQGAFREGGDRFGTHRAKDNASATASQPPGLRRVLPQQAHALDVSLPIFVNEMLIDVESLNIDSASFRQIKEECGADLGRMENHISGLVKKRGKHHNPVTGSGGMLIGTVSAIGPAFWEPGKPPVQAGDRIATLVSLTLTPLEIRKIKAIHLQSDRVDVEGRAILFASGLYSKLPADIPEALALAVLDVCGAPAQTRALCKPGQTVVVVGGAGKSGVLCLYEAAKAVGPTGKVIALDCNDRAVQTIKALSFAQEAHAVDARDALEVHELVRKATAGAMADVVINVANIADTEMSCILSAKRGGSVYFFSMATSFTRATLGAEGVGAHVDLMMGNGYRPGHAELSLNILRESPEIREMYESKYGAS